MYVCMCVCMCIHTSLNTDISTLIRLYIHACTHRHTFLCTCSAIYTHTHIHTCIHHNYHRKKCIHEIYKIASKNFVAVTLAQTTYTHRKRTSASKLHTHTKNVQDELHRHSWSYMYTRISHIYTEMLKCVTVSLS